MVFRISRTEAKASTRLVSRTTWGWNTNSIVNEAQRTLIDQRVATNHCLNPGHSFPPEAPSSGKTISNWIFAASCISFTSSCLGCYSQDTPQPSMYPLYFLLILRSQCGHQSMHWCRRPHHSNTCISIIKGFFFHLGDGHAYVHCKCLKEPLTRWRHCRCIR